MRPISAGWLLALVVLVAACDRDALPGTTAPTAATSTTVDLAKEVPVDEARVARLAAYARLINLVRFFHPSDEAAETDWARFISDTYPVVMDGEGREGLAEVLERIIAPVAPTVRIYASEAPPPPAWDLVDTSEETLMLSWFHRGVVTPEVEARPSGPERIAFSSDRVLHTLGGEVPSVPPPSEPVQVDLGGGVSALVPISVYSQGGRTVPQGEGSERWRADPHLAVLWGQYPREEEATRVAAVILAWGMYEYFYPYWDLVDADWNQVLVETLAAVLAESDVSYEDLLQSMLASTSDGHIGNLKAGSIPPFSWNLVEEKLIVTKVTLPDVPVTVGDEIVSVDGIPASTAVAQAARHVPAATAQHRQLAALLDLALGESGSEMVLEVRTGDEATRTVTVRRTSPWNQITHVIDEPRPSPVSHLGEGILYIDLTRLTAHQLAAAEADFQDAAGLLLDLRGYPTITSIELLSRLLDRPTPGPPVRVPLRTGPLPEHLSFEEVNWSIEPVEPHLPQPKVFLTDGRAMSAAETWVGVAKWQQIGQVVGGPTAGTNGLVNRFHLPGGLVVSMTGYIVTKPDGQPHYGVGVIPTVTVARTHEGVTAGDDEVLQAGLELLKSP